MGRRILVRDGYNIEGIHDVSFNIFRKDKSFLAFIRDIVFDAIQNGYTVEIEPFED